MRAHAQGKLGQDRRAASLDELRAEARAACELATRAPRVRPLNWVARRPSALSSGGSMEKTFGLRRVLHESAASADSSACPSVGVCLVRGPEIHTGRRTVCAA